MYCVTVKSLSQLSIFYTSRLIWQNLFHYISVFVSVSVQASACPSCWPMCTVWCPFLCAEEEAVV